jgi:hypothetical protein
MNYLCQELMFPSATRRNGEKFVYWYQEAWLNSAFVTRIEPDGKKVMLSQPRADACNGYICRRFAEASSRNVAVPFTSEEEEKLTEDPELPCVLQDILVLFLTAQYKKIHGDRLEVAMYQSARDGTDMCEYLHRFYKRAGLPANEVDTCHWSITSDTDTVRLYLHWREHTAGVPSYHMQEIYRAPLAGSKDDPNNDQMRQLRDRLRNIKDYAVEERLARIKQALKFIPLPSKSPKKSRGNSTLSKQQTIPAASPEKSLSITANRPNFAPSTGTNPFKDHGLRGTMSNSAFGQRLRQGGVSEPARATEPRRSTRQPKPNTLYPEETYFP